MFLKIVTSFQNLIDTILGNTLKAGFFWIPLALTQEKRSWAYLETLITNIVFWKPNSS